MTLWAVASVLGALDLGTLVALWRLRRRLGALEARHSVYGTHNGPTQPPAG
jgi:hypothetical protein